MRSYTASFGASIWTETSISSSQEMYFNQNKEGGMFRLVQFQSSDEAKQLYGCPSSISEWRELAVVVKAINESTNYEANMEMNIFINYLESENAKCFTDLSKLPLFWTPEERRLFPRAFWNFIKGKSSLSSVMSISPFGESVNVIENDPILRQIKHVDNSESQFGKDPYVSSFSMRG
ncbi:hypothetical protein LOK49_LG15G02294 [Camellia lanceoleosa]|uniref:Uncharacterized protein n=1 Tax=Camellia lanceoleosa TaxID=1840588 RepID=A0ACC0F7F9_9ERIC|nr:hypothetical protein LOK49_LG15G02294 [Camellia lanceoleosa]